eukprot:5360942-Pleurochrysis_carterae.AAC.1
MKRNRSKGGVFDACDPLRRHSKSFLIDETPNCSRAKCEGEAKADWHLETARWGRGGRGKVHSEEGEKSWERKVRKEIRAPIAILGSRGIRRFARKQAN